ncbi:MAG: low molecular weight protein arginine phosphatase [Ruminococcaceae bacterium]|nr:low molecular weight protein arginine phosphatase [Oscillospiraceae bacterium]
MTETALKTARLSQGDADIRRVLFVCTGNTCRSPMAAALFNDMMNPREVCSACPDGVLGKTVALATSAGLFAIEGAPISAGAKAALQGADIPPHPQNDYTLHRARTVTEALMAEADEVVGISASHAMELTLRFPQYAGKIRTLPMDISDPFGGDLAVYRQCLMQLRYCLQIYCAEGRE